MESAVVGEILDQGRRACFSGSASVLTLERVRCVAGISSRRTPKGNSETGSAGRTETASERRLRFPFHSTESSGQSHGFHTVADRLRLEPHGLIVVQMIRANVEEFAA